MQQKILGEERRQLLLQWLQESDKPLSGSALSKKTNVSRQVIVQDISLLKARNIPIIATPQGYIYLKQNEVQHNFERVVACQHTKEEMEKEMYLIVDYGVTIKDVKVEHPLYGDLTASIMVSNRYEVAHFLKKMQTTNATPLSFLTDGAHLHTLKADSEAKLNAAYEGLKQAGFLIEP